MSLKKCTSCGGDVAGTADKCPHCGAVGPGEKYVVIGCLICIMAVIGFAAWCHSVL